MEVYDVTNPFRFIGVGLRLDPSGSSNQSKPKLGLEQISPSTPQAQQIQAQIGPRTDSGSAQKEAHSLQFMPVVPVCSSVHKQTVGSPL